MNPLAAMRQIVTPDLRSLQGLGAGDASAPKNIPSAELQKAGLVGGTVDSTRVAGAKGDFGSVLGNLVGEVASRQAAASQNVNGLLSGQNVSLHEAMISMEEASVSFQFMVEVRNKLLESYQELMRMQV